MQLQTQFKQFAVIVVVIVLYIVRNSDTNPNECIEMHVKT